MRRRSVASSAITSIGYDEKKKSLDVEFVTGRVYRYFDVDAATAESFRQAPSKGRFFNAHIRDEYEFVELRSEPKQRNR